MKKPIIIIGDSPFLENIEDKVHYLLELYPSMGINNAIRKYNITSHIFQDMKFISLTNRYPEIKTISLYMYGDMIEKENKELYDSYTFNFKTNTAQDIIKDNKLAWCGFTHDYAISYCIMKGYSHVILAGTADFTGSSHYLTEEQFNPAEKLVGHSKKFIEEVCSKKIKIYTLNPESTLNVPRIKIEKLFHFNRK